METSIETRVTVVPFNVGDKTELKELETGSAGLLIEKKVWESVDDVSPDAKVIHIVFYEITYDKPVTKSYLLKVLKVLNSASDIVIHPNFASLEDAILNTSTLMGTPGFCCKCSSGVCEYKSLEEHITEMDTSAGLVVAYY